MSSPTLQFVVAGALVVAWAWMLGRPLLTSLFRRSRRDSVGHFRYQQAVLSQQPSTGHRSSRSWGDRPRPLLNWTSQPLERRRLQVMLGFGMATFVSLLMAIAVRGFFTRLFVVMVVCFLVYLCTAAYIGSVQLRRQQEVSIARRRSASGQVAQQSIDADHVVDHGQVQRASVLFPEPDNTLEEHDALGGVLDDDFFEPIPELQFEPLNLDSSLFDPSKSEQESLFGTGDERDLSGEFFEQLIGRDDTGDFFSIDADGWIAEPVFEGQGPVSNESFESESLEHEMPANIEIEAEADRYGAEAMVDSEPADADIERREPTFKAAPVQRPRPQKRNRARPIYIESQLDEGDDQVKAVND